MASSIDWKNFGNTKISFNQSINSTLFKESATSIVCTTI